MLKSDTTQIDGTTFTTTQLPAMRAYTLLARLLKVAGPVLAGMVQMDPSTELSDALPKLAGALSTLEPADAEALALEILANTSAQVQGPNGGPMRETPLSLKANVDYVFSGRVMTMLKVIFHVVKFNYSDFSLGVALPAQGATPIDAGSPAAS